MSIKRTKGNRPVAETVPSASERQVFKRMSRRGVRSYDTNKYPKLIWRLVRLYRTTSAAMLAKALWDREDRAREAT
jgi:hypothetical protein